MGYDPKIHGMPSAVLPGNEDPEIAAAEKRGRIAGLREAAHWLAETEPEHHVVRRLRWYADKLEQSP